MKPIKSLLVLAIMLTPALALAQPGYYQPYQRLPGGFHNRMGRLAVGGSLGVGGMSDSGGAVSCNNCNYNALAGEGDFHVGAFLAPRFALMLELQGNLQTVHSTAYNDTTLTQGAAMIAGQFWLTPILWVKGGVGVAHLSLDTRYTSSPIDSGAAVMGAIGVELISARHFALDLQGRVIEGAYHGIDDNITSATVGLGLNWY